MSSKDDIAIVGMALRVPGATSLEQFWTNVVSGRDCLTRPDKGAQERAGVSAREIAGSSHIAAKPLLDEFKGFDARFFGVSEIQAKMLDLEDVRPVSQHLRQFAHRSRFDDGDAAMNSGSC